MGRLIVVSNRLPITIEDKDGTYSYKMSSGGLVSALAGFKEAYDFVWVGWPGFDVSEDKQQQLAVELQQQYNCVPVFIPADIANGYYNGFANGVLWPIFHYIPRNVEYDENDWTCYKRANEIFGMTLAEVIKPGDVLWIHDYHLMLLPAIIAHFCGFHVPMGFFLHIPFPSSEVYRLLPYREEILQGLLHCSIVGFHVYDYSRHFISACNKLLRCKTSPNSVHFEGREVRVCSIPIGIEPEAMLRATEEGEFEVVMKELEAQYEGKTLILGVDRLDYIKGIPQKIAAFAACLEKYPDYIGKVCLLQIAIPTRSDVEKYKELKSCVDELVGRINGQYGTPTYLPIVLIHHSISKAKLTALYQFADVCLITSSRDGMNLVALEYIAVRAKRAPGTLVLSEFAGASQPLRNGFNVNPWDIEETAETIHRALSTKPVSLESSMKSAVKYVYKYTSSNWAKTFLEELVPPSTRVF